MKGGVSVRYPNNSDFFFPKYIFINLGNVYERLRNEISSDIPLRRDSARRGQLEDLLYKCTGHDIKIKILNIFIW